MKYKTILCDPPWKETGGGKIKRGADKHYQVLNHNQIVVLTKEWLSDCVDENAHLYLWVTNGHLPDGLKLMEELNFRYITNIAWFKDRIGLGRYFRGMHELCLFGTRGNGWKVRTSSNSVRGTIHEKKREHSRKPESFYNVIESRSEGPYLELFGRQVRNGWDVKGDETNLFNLNVKQENESLQDNYVEVADVGGTEGG